MLLKKVEVAERLRVHPRTVANYVRRGDLRAIRVGNAYRFDADEVDAYLRRSATDADVSPLDAHVAALVAEAPALSESQRSALAALLGGAR